MMRDQAIRHTHPTVVTINAETDAYDQAGNHVILNEALIAAEVARLQAEYAARQYQRDRAQAYPSIVDQLDTLYHGGYEGWRQQIQAVKDRYPKGQP